MLTSLFMCSSIHFYHVFVIQLFLKMMFSSWLLRSPRLNSWKQLFNFMFSHRIIYIIVKGLVVIVFHSVPIWCFPFSFVFFPDFVKHALSRCIFLHLFPSRFSILQHIYSVVLCCVSEDKADVLLYDESYIQVNEMVRSTKGSYVHNSVLLISGAVFQEKKWLDNPI